MHRIANNILLRLHKKLILKVNIFKLLAISLAVELLIVLHISDKINL